MDNQSCSAKRACLFQKGRKKYLNPIKFAWPWHAAHKTNIFRWWRFYASYINDYFVQIDTCLIEIYCILFEHKPLFFVCKNRKIVGSLRDFLCLFWMQRFSIIQWCEMADGKIWFRNKDLINWMFYGIAEWAIVYSWIGTFRSS